MKNRGIFAATLMFVLFACDDKDNAIPERTLLLTLTVDASYVLTNIGDHWIIVHGEDGSLLASESFEANQELEILTDKPAPGKITVTHLVYSISSGNKRYFAASYLNIEKGKHMILKLDLNKGVYATGKLNVSVSNIGSLDHQSLSGGLLISGSESWNSGTGILDLESPTFTGGSKYFVTVSDGYSLRHKVLNNVQPNDSYSFSLDDMNPFDQTVDFTFPQSNGVWLYVVGSQPDATLTPNNYVLINHSNTDAHNSIKSGYLNSLTNYSTQLNISYPDYAYEYVNNGSIPDGNVTWPQKSDFHIGEKSFNNFSATSSKSYVWRFSTWSYSDEDSQTGITWSVSAPPGNQFIQELPSEITSVHPVLSLNNLVHTSTTFYTQSPAFESFVNSDFETTLPPAGMRLGIKITN